MPELHVADQHWSVATGSNLLDSLNQAGVPVPYSCRAGSCHACLVRCVRGEPLDLQPDALTRAQREQGWRLACQCQVVEDMQVEAFDPVRDGEPAEVAALDWLSPSVLRLGLYRGAHCVTARGSIWCCGPAAGWRAPIRWPVCRVRTLCWWCMSIAALAERSSMRRVSLRSATCCAWASCAVARCITTLTGRSCRCGSWPQARGWGRFTVCCAKPCVRSITGRSAWCMWPQTPPGITSSRSWTGWRARIQHCVEYVLGDELADYLVQMRLVSRQTRALVCGHPDTVQAFAKRLFLAGLSRNQLMADVFLTRS